MKIKFVHLSLDLAYGGPPQTIVHLANAMAKQDSQVSILTADRHVPALANELDKRITFKGCGYIGPRIFRYSPRLQMKLRRCAMEDGRDMIIHSRGIWTYPECISGKVARNMGVPHIISIEGMLEPWALNRSRWKKAVIGRFFTWRNLMDAACIHALREGEAQSIRKLGIKAPIAIIPNGVNVPENGKLRSSEQVDLFKRFPDLRNQKLIVHLGRIHPVKGLPRTLKAWRQIAGRFPDWHLAIAGPDEGGHTNELNMLVNVLGLQKRASLIGPVYEKEKDELLRQSSVFILASEMEGMSCALLEAMAWELPVLITRECCFDEVETHQSGLIVHKDSDDIARGLVQLLSMSDMQRGKLGENGRQLMVESYDWKILADTYYEVYSWLLGKREKPDCVCMN